MYPLFLLLYFSLSGSLLSVSKVLAANSFFVVLQTIKNDKKVEPAKPAFLIKKLLPDSFLLQKAARKRIWVLCFLLIPFLTVWLSSSPIYTFSFSLFLLFISYQIPTYIITFAFDCLFLCFYFLSFPFYFYLFLFFSFSLIIVCCSHFLFPVFIALARSVGSWTFF